MLILRHTSTWFNNFLLLLLSSLLLFFNIRTFKINERVRFLINFILLIELLRLIWSKRVNSVIKIVLISSLRRARSCTSAARHMFLQNVVSVETLAAGFAFIRPKNNQNKKLILFKKILPWNRFTLEKLLLMIGIR